MIFLLFFFFFLFDFTENQLLFLVLFPNNFWLYWKSFCQMNCRIIFFDGLWDCFRWLIGGNVVSPYGFLNDWYVWFWKLHCWWVDRNLKYQVGWMHNYLWFKLQDQTITDIVCVFHWFGLNVILISKLIYSSIFYLFFLVHILLALLVHIGNLWRLLWSFNVINARQFM